MYNAQGQALAYRAYIAYRVHIAYRAHIAYSAYVAYRAYTAYRAYIALRAHIAYGRRCGAPCSLYAVNTLVFNGFASLPEVGRRVPWVVSGESAGSRRGVAGESVGVHGNLWRPGKTAFCTQK